MNLDQYLKELEHLVNTDSCSDDPKGLDLMAEFFSDRFRKMDWIVETKNFAPQSGTCVVCKNREAEHYDLMMIGHIDTVFPRGMLEKNPFRIEGDKIYGLGVADMKQGALMMYHIVKNLDKEVLDKLNIALIFNPDEEIGSIYSRPALTVISRSRLSILLNSTIQCAIS